MPYRYEYGVEDEYSGSSYRASQAGDEEGAVEGEYTVLLPDGRTQHVRYHADHALGYTAEVTYDGAAAYPQAKGPHF